MKKIILTAVSILAAVGIILGMTAGTGVKTQGTPVRAITLEKQDLKRTVSATGMVYSSQSTNVYSNMNYPVGTVHVAVGDRVNEGDILAELDMSALQSDISQKQASVSAAQSTANQNLASAKSDLEIYRRNAENGNDSNLLNAQATLNTAEMDVQNAKLDVQGAELDVQSANNNWSIARRELRDARDDGADDSELDGLQDNVRSCETAMEKAQTSLEKAKSNLEKAKENLKKAKASNETAKVSSADSLVAYENKVKSARLATDHNDQYIYIQKLQDELGKSAILSPVSGTVTAVNAVTGGSGNGLLFVIQETENLKVVTNIKEYDVASVSVGDKVTIKADATGEQVFDGTLSKIAPTSTLTATGSAQSSTDAEYESEVAVSSKSKGLRIGMNTRLSIITQEKKSVYAVPYEAVSKNEAGENIVYIASHQEDDSFIAGAVTVTTGMETDLYIEISGDGLDDGTLVISNAEGIASGAVVQVL